MRGFRKVFTYTPQRAFFLIYALTEEIVLFPKYRSRTHQNIFSQNIMKMPKSMYIREEWSLYVYKYLIGNDAGNQSDPGAGGGGCKSGLPGFSMVGTVNSQVRRHRIACGRHCIIWKFLFRQGGSRSICPRQMCQRPKPGSTFQSPLRSWNHWDTFRKAVWNRSC